MMGMFRMTNLWQALRVALLSLPLALVACSGGGSGSGAGDAPVVSSAIANQMLDANGSAVTINLLDVFTDPEGQALTFTIRNSNSGAVSASLSGTNLVLAARTSSGTATITVSASDGSNSVSDVFSVSIINPATEGPTLREPIPDFSLRVGNREVLDLTAYFKDEQTPAASLSYTFSKVGDAATASITGSNMEITAGADSGTSTFTVTAKDADNNSVSDSFSVTVVRQNAAPTIESVGAFGGRNPSTDFKLGTLAVKLGGSSDVIDLRQVFTDDASSDDELSFAVQIADTSIASFTQNGASVRFNGVASGTTTGSIVVTDAESNATASSSFGFRLAVSNGPVAQSMPDLMLQAREVRTQIDLNTYFTDPDGGELSYVVVSNNTSAARPELDSSGNNLSLTAGGRDATATITVTASNDGGLSAQTSFQVSIDNAAPNLIGSGVPDQTIAAGRAVDLPLLPYVEDREDSFSELQLATPQFSNTAIASVSATRDIEANHVLRIEAGSEFGQGQVTLTFTDTGGDKLIVSFMLTVAGSSAPVVSNPVVDFGLAPDAEAPPLILEAYDSNGDPTGIFSDPDEDDRSRLNFSVTPSNSNVSYALVGNELRLRAQGTLGQSTQFDITARDTSGAQVSESFVVSIVDDAPRIACAFADRIDAPPPGQARPAFVALEIGMTDGPAGCSGDTVTPDIDFDGDASVLDLDVIFVDSPPPGRMTYQISTSDSDVVSWELNSENQLRLLARDVSGSARIRVVAKDANGNAAVQEFEVINQAQTVAPIFDNPPMIDVDRKGEDQRILINLGRYVRDADLSDQDEDRPGVDACAPEDAQGRGGYEFAVQNVSNPAIATVQVNGCELEVTVLQRIGEAQVALQATDADGDIAFASLQIVVAKPVSNLLVVNADSGEIARYSRDLAETAMLTYNWLDNDPGADGGLIGGGRDPSVLGFAGGLAVDRAGQLYQAGVIGNYNANCPGAPFIYSQQPAIKVMHNALNRVPEPPNSVAPNVRGPAVISAWHHDFDRNLQLGSAATADCTTPSVPAPDRQPNELVYVDEARLIVEVAGDPSAPVGGDGNANNQVFEAVRFIAADAGQLSSGGTHLGGIDFTTLLATGGPRFDAGNAEYSFHATDVAYAPRSNQYVDGALFVTVVLTDDNGTNPPQLRSAFVRCNNPFVSGVSCEVLDPTASYLTGVAYIPDTDSIIVTDAGSMDNDADGRVLIFHQLGLATGGVTPSTTIAQQSATCLGDPMDVDVEITASGADLWVADRACTAADGSAGSLLHFVDGATLGSPRPSSYSAAYAAPAASHVLVHEMPRGQAPDATDPELAGEFVNREALDIIVALEDGSAMKLRATAALNDQADGMSLMTATSGLVTFDFDTDAVSSDVPDIAGLAIDVDGALMATTESGASSLQRGGIRIASLGAKTALGLNVGSAEDFTAPVPGRVIETQGGGNEATDLVTPVAIDIAGQQGVMIVSDPRTTSSISPEGAIQVYAYGSEHNVQPLFSTLFQNVQPWGLDYDPQADRLYVSTNAGTIVIFDNYLELEYTEPTRPQTARVITPVDENGVKVSGALAGLVHTSGDTVLVADREKNDVLILRIPAGTTGNVEVDYRLSDSGMSLLGTWDLALDAANEQLYVVAKDHPLRSGPLIRQLKLLRDDNGVIAGVAVDDSGNPVFNDVSLPVNVEGVLAVPAYVRLR